MSEYSQSPILITMSAPLGGAIRRVAVDNAGKTKSVLWWDWANGTWDAEFTPADHVRAFDRLASDPTDSAEPDHKTQSLAVPIAPFADPATILTVYLLDEAGEPKDVSHSLTRGEVAIFCDILR